MSCAAAFLARRPPWERASMREGAALPAPPKSPRQHRFLPRGSSFKDIDEALMARAIPPRGTKTGAPAPPKPPLLAPAEPPGTKVGAVAEGRLPATCVAGDQYASALAFFKVGAVRVEQPDSVEVTFMCDTVIITLSESATTYKCTGPGDPHRHRENWN